jgi:DNA-3-methyladenine glycosylase
LKKKLNTDFYLREDVVEISKELLGKFLVTSFNGEYSSGIITETEAYNGVIDRASHAYNNRRTKRNEIMYAEGGVAYIYLCYGMHHLFNIVTNKKDIPHAILIRAIMAWEGIDIMSKRRNKNMNELPFAKGPGTLSEALGIKTAHSGLSLTGNTIWLEDRGMKFKSNEIIAGPRIGVDYAGTDAALPYRFRLTQNTIQNIVDERNS